MAEELQPVLRAVGEAVLAVAAHRSVDDVLQQLTESARELAGARYSALGLPDGEGGFRRFLVAGMSEDLIARMGPLPRTHGVLGAMLERAVPHRTDDLHREPAFRGWWPSGHPDMRSFLGVPIVDGAGGVIGAFYLTHKEGGETFTDRDEDVIGLLAAHAAIAITDAELLERGRELSTLAERQRLAAELHDAVSQKLFSLVLTAEAAGTLLERGDPAARERVGRLQELAREALDELRGLVGELRPPDVDREGLATALRKHVDVLRGVHATPIALTAEETAPVPERDREVLRVAQEALHNALRHADATAITVTLAADGDGVRLEIGDDGHGFAPDAPALRGHHLGLTSMEERAARLGGRLEIRSAPGDGTLVVLEAPGG